MKIQSQEILYNYDSHALQDNCKVLRYVNESLGQLIQRRLRELDISKADVAKKVGVSRAYIGALANGTAKTQSGFYRPKPEIVSKLAEALHIAENDILDALGYAPESSQKGKPQTVSEFVTRLNEMGFVDLQFDAKVDELTPDDLQDVIDMIEANLLVKIKKL